MKKLNSNQSGIALMIVLWVLVLLMALATEFAFSMKMEVNTTRNYKEDTESYYLAKAGLNLALAELLKDASFHSIHDEYGWITGAGKSTKTPSDDGDKAPAEGQGILTSSIEPTSNWEMGPSPTPLRTKMEKYPSIRPAKSYSINSWLIQELRKNLIKTSFRIRFWIGLTQIRTTVSMARKMIIILPSTRPI